ncbi:MAG: DUF975 family protein [Blautia sp.]|nr:DUF975 family protein [Blautia sp.]MCM1199952.1 DUF975 family protein [Bacteroides fragilis]
MKWTRKELKERAKEALRRNYWKAVFVSFIFLLLSGGASSSAASSHTNDGKGERVNALIAVEERALDGIGDSIERSLGRLGEARVVFLAAFAIVMAVIFFIVVIVWLAADVFLVNPLWVGAQRFMLKSVDDRADISELGYTFDHHYLNGVKTMFMRDLHVFLWALLFIIPGIYRKYQYYMVDFILAENPDMPYREVLAYSRKMMDGQKWDAFVLDLSFIPWQMLSFFTCGISEIAFVKPYINLTRAALYRALCGGGQGGYENGL